MAYGGTLIYKQLCKDLDLCSFPYVSYLEKRFNQIYRALYGTQGHQYDGRKVTEQLLSFAIKSISYHSRDRMQEPFQKQKRSRKIIFSPTKQPSNTTISCHVTQKLGN